MIKISTAIHTLGRKRKEKEQTNNTKAIQTCSIVLCMEGWTHVFLGLLMLGEYYM